jgi:hypothetical protein
MACEKAVNGVSGTAHGTVTSHKDFGRLVVRAIGHLLLQGAQQCIGPCDNGTCGFSLTSVNEDVQISKDAAGDGVTVTVTGDGKCACA